MWSYYGGKSKLVKHYPTPKHDLIIEPFAGSARYALKYWERDVLLVDKYEEVIKLWKWLQQCSPNDILKLPILKVGQNIKEMGFNEGEILLMQWYAAGGVATPQHKVTKFGAENSKSFQKKIALNLHKIKHWKIQHGSFEDIPNQIATWYVDPPYQFGGEHYKESSKKIDFKKLGEWCMNREGQTIVCENTKADWLPFKPLVKFKGLQKTTTEAIWSNHATAFDNEQLELF
jgi:site-specific DNA-adenine methylase